MKPFFKELFEYSHHYNQQLAELLTTHGGKAPEKALQLFNHILNAHHIWNHRIEGNKPAVGVWDINPMETLKEMDKTNFDHSLQILDRFDLNETIQYSTSKGIPFQSSVRDILFHVINHSTYHRGQIAMEFRQQGLEPLASDYIFYKR